MAEPIDVDFEEDQEPEHPVNTTASRSVARQREIRRKIEDAIEKKRLEEEFGVDLD